MSSLKILSLRMPTGAATGYVLTSDASGNASWAPSAAANDFAYAFFIGG